MDSIRSISVSVAQFAVLGVLSPVFADIAEEDSKHHRQHGHGKANAVSHFREDYPVIWNWMSSPDNPEAAANSNTEVK